MTFEINNLLNVNKKKFLKIIYFYNFYVILRNKTIINKSKFIPNHDVQTDPYFSSIKSIGIKPSKRGKYILY